MALLHVDGLTRRFGGVRALHGVSFAVERGTITSLIGPNGAGKTTVFNCITGVLRPQAGRLQFGTDPVQELVGLPPHAVARCGISRTFQNIRLFADMSVLDNVLVGTYGRTQGTLWQALWPRLAGGVQEERWASERAHQLLRWAGLEASAAQRAGSLPYGRQRRLELARALAAEPQLLLLDEPAAGLTSGEKRELLGLLRQLVQQGISIVLIEHDMEIVMPISDWVVVLDDGEKIAEGPPAAIQCHPAVIEAYLGSGAAEPAAC